MLVLEFLIETHTFINNICINIYEKLATNLIDNFLPFYKAAFGLIIAILAIQMLVVPKGRTIMSFLITIFLLTATYLYMIQDTKNKYIIHQNILKLPFILSSFNNEKIKSIDDDKNSNTTNTTSKILITTADKIIIDVTSGITIFNFLERILPLSMGVIVYIALYTLLIAYWIIIYNYIIIATIMSIIGLPIILGIPFKMFRPIFFNWLKYLLEISIKPMLIALIIIFTSQVIAKLSQDLLEKVTLPTLLITLFTMLIMLYVIKYSWLQIPRITTIFTNNVDPENPMMDILSDIKSKAMSAGTIGSKGINKVAKGAKNYSKMFKKGIDSDSATKDEKDKRNDTVANRKDFGLKPTEKKTSNPQKFNKQNLAKNQNKEQKNNIQSKNKKLILAIKPNNNPA